jgi:Mn2+/Fe2+ NRAMP family transporter
MSTAPPQSASSLPSPGCLPEWGEQELPAPPPYSTRSALKLIGPAAIALGTAIGSGEWLLGPAVTAKYGAALLWVATVSIVLQVILNQEMMRYTIATGEPIFTGFLRSKPGPLFWGSIYTVLMFLQIGWPGWALSGATAIVAAFKGSIPGEADKQLVLNWGYVTFFLSIAIIATGGKIEKTLERVQWFMIAWILIFLLIVGVFFTSMAVWGKVFFGYVGIGGTPIPRKEDWALLASFAAFAGMGGLGNGTLTNWVRDKGWGMAATVGHISGLVGGRQVELSQVGNRFRLSPESLTRFREWMKYVRFEQAWIFGAGCFLGMGLPALMTLQFVPPGADITGQWGTATYQADGLRRAFGQTAWFLTLLNGFWILFSTQLGNTDIFCRTVTDILWSSHPRIQQYAKNDVRRVYFATLFAFTLFGMWAIRQATPGQLILMSASIAVFNFIIMALHVIYVQRRFLPPELRMSRLREGLILCFVVFFTVFLVLGIWSKWNDIAKAFGLG